MTSEGSIVGLSLPFPGVTRVFEEGQKLGLWDFVRLAGYHEKQEPIPPAKVYILGAWHSSYHQLVDSLPLEAKKIVLWTSSSGEMGFEPQEQGYLSQVLQDTRIHRIWFGDPGLALLYPERGFYAPYPLNYEPRPVALKQDYLTLFCPLTLKKNIFNQLIAISLVQKKEPRWTLHTNLPIDRTLFPLMNVISHSWLPRDQYEAIIAAAQLNLACSWSETFNYNVAEATLLGTPSIVSPVVPWAPMSWMALPHNPEDIADTILLALKDPPMALIAFRKALKYYGDNAETELKKKLAALKP